MNVGLQALRAKVRGFHITGEKLRRGINKTTGKRRANLWRAKRALGWYMRYHLVAYGLLRGIPYERMERCAENNVLDARKLHELIQQHADPQGTRKWTLEATQAALETARA